jgi:hypothetical protein
LTPEFTDPYSAVWPQAQEARIVRPASARPPLITAAGIVLIVAGALSVVSALILLSLAGGLGILYVLIGLAVGAASIWAGWMVLQLREQGRNLGLILAIVGAVFALIALIQGSTISIINLALDAFLIYALSTTRQYFTV